MSREESIRALRRSNPRRSPGFDESLEGLDAVHDRIVASDAGVAPRRRQTPVRVRVAWASAAAVVIVGAVAAFVLTAPGTPGGKGPVAIENAYAAVSQAVYDTAAAAKSGTIMTVTTAYWPERPNPMYETTSTPEWKRPVEPDTRKTLPASSIRLNTTFKWNGNDMSLVVGVDEEGPSKSHESRFVDGVYYEESDKAAPGEPEPQPTQWVRYAEDRPMGADESPQEWVKAAQSDVTGANLRRIISATKGLEQKTNDDGSITYSGTATAQAIKADGLGVTGLPYISGPLIKVHDLETPVAVSITVGSDGLIREVRCRYESDGARWEYRSTYHDLGSTGTIGAPDPANVRDWDPSEGKG